MAKKRELKLKVSGDRRATPDARRMARAIVRLAVELDSEQAQALADTLEDEEVLRRRSLTRARAEQRRSSETAGKVVGSATRRTVAHESGESRWGDSA